MIREFRRADADKVAALLNEAEPPEGVTGPGIVHWQEKQPERAHVASWVAEEDGEIVGWSRAAMRWAVSSEQVGGLWGFVHPTQRRRGLGSELHERGAAHLLGCGARVLESWSTTEPEARLLLAQGFRPARKGTILALETASADLSGLPELERRMGEDGFRLVPLAAVLDRTRDLHAVDAEAIEDVPDTYAEDDVRFEDWLDEALGHPQLTKDGSFVALHRERPVAHALIHLEPGSRIAANEMTATARDFRRRGLARLVKLATIRWAVENGFPTIMTGTDEANAGMNALNESLGYRPIATETQYLREDLS
ncbi:MAG: GNAT family N-acetyltransferase [Gaiellaceae bacterium]